MAETSPVIKVKAVMSPFRVGQQTYYRLVTESAKNVSEEEFIQLAAEKAKKDPIQARFWGDIYRKVLFSELIQNHTVDLVDFYAKLYVGGSITSANQQPNKVTNPVRARIRCKGTLADTVAALDVVNDTLTVGATLYDVQQDGADEANLLTTANARTVVTGTKLTMDPERTDNGVWLETLEGIKVKDATVTHSDAAVIYCKFAELPEDGKYRLVVATRNADDPETYSLDVLKRVVTVKNPTTIKKGE